MSVSRPRILALCGSGRRGSWNGKLLAVAAQGAIDGGADVTTINLAALQLPLYVDDPQVRAMAGDAARELQALVREHAGLLVATPEHNGSMPALLKNALDWAVDPDGGDATTSMFAGKAAALLSASKERIAGLKGLASLSSCLGCLGVLVQPPMLGVGMIETAFDAYGGLADKQMERRVRDVGTALSKLLSTSPHSR